MNIIIDFDGSVVTHNYPKVGKDIGAVPVLLELVENNHNLILFTMRCNNSKGNYLSDAVEWFENNNIPLFGIQKNPSQYIWTTSPKAHGDLIIDDICLGIPLIYGKHERPYIDWIKVREMLLKMDII